MTTYRLMDGLSGRPGNGPAAPTALTGNYEAGVAFKVTSFGLWFQGYYWWVPGTGGQTTTGQKFALWQVTGASAGTLVANSTVTAGTLTANAWNFVALPTPLLLTSGVAYLAATGYVSTAGFPKTGAQFGTGNPYAAGITNGPLMAYSSTSGSNTVGGASWLPQMPFTTGSADPAAAMPTLNDADDNLWIDVQVSDTAPGGASYRAFPNMPVASLVGGGPQSLAYTLGMEFSLSQSCTLKRIWHYSAPTSTVLPLRCGIWNVGTTTEVAGTDNSAPTWLLPSGSAASAGAGWIYCDYSGAGVTLASGVNYKVSTFTTDNTHVWFGTTTNYFSTGPGGSGITAGPLSLPNNASASPGQASWNQGITWTYPSTSTSPENDWIDVEVTPVGGGTAHTATAALTVTPSFSAARARGRFRTGALTVTPSFSTARVRGRNRTGTLTVTPSFSAARTHGHARTGHLTVTPSFTATRSAGHTRRASLTITPHFLATASGGAVAAAVLFAAVGARQLWSTPAARNQ